MKNIFLTVSILVGFLLLPGLVKETKAVNIINPSTNLADYPGNKVPQYKKLEITFTLDTVYTNPFNPDEIKVDGYFVSPTKTLIHPGFYYQNYSVTGIGSSESYSLNGSPVWKLRFTPSEVGLYQYYIKISDKNGTFTSSTNTFEVVSSSNPGFIKVSQKNNRYFEYDNGKPFIGLGLDVGWWQYEDQRIITYQYYLNRMAENKANLARVWMTNSGRSQNWILSIQDKNLGSDYNLEEAWAFDYILNLAETNDIALLLTLEDVNQYTYNWGTNLYNTALGGPCSSQMCIFTNATAKKNQKQLFRYLVARWGYSPSILSWEFFNEIDELQWSVSDWNWQSILNWHQEMGQYINSIDAFKHLTNTSTGSFKTHPDLYQALPEMNLAEMHFYYVPGWQFAPSDPQGQDMANLMRYYSFLLYNSVSNKPSIVGEWGILNENWVASPYLDSDDKGVHIHNGLWSSLMSGMASSGLVWYWDYFKVHDTTWWPHYKPLANYFADLDIGNLTVMKPVNVDFSLPNGADNRPDSFASSNSKLRAMGLHNDTTTYVWIQNTDNTWWNYVHGLVPTVQTGKITVYGLTPNSNYTLEWWDTYNGSITASSVLSTNGSGNVDLQISALQTDLAVKLTKSGTPTPTPSISPVHCLPLGDIDCSKRVDSADLLTLLKIYGRVAPAPNKEDLDDNGLINAIDLSIIIDNFGKSI